MFASWSATGLPPEDRPIALFLPEPNSMKAVNCQPPELKQLWLKAIKDKLKILISNGRHIQPK
jgi:hypothetical protein